MGTTYVEVADELLDRLSDDWSEPVQLKLRWLAENRVEFILRTVDSASPRRERVECGGSVAEVTAPPERETR